MAEGFGFAVAGDFGEGAVDGGDALFGVGDHHAFGGAFEDGGSLQELFLHLLALGDVAGDGEDAGFAVDGDGLGGEFAEADAAALGAYRGGEVAQAALVADGADHLLAVFGIGPDAEFEGGAVGGFAGDVAGDAGEAFVGFDEPAVDQAGDEQAVGGCVEGAGEFLFGDLQLLLGFLDQGDVAHDDDEGGDAVEVDGLRGDEAGEAFAVLPAEGHFQVVQAFVLQALEEAGPHVGGAPDAQFGGGTADGLGGVDAGLLLEGAVDVEQAAVLAAGEGDDVGAVVEYGGELLLGEAQGVFGVLGFGDVDHQAADDLAVALGVEGDDVADPQDAAVGSEHAVVETVVAPGGDFFVADVFGVLGVFGMEGALPEAGFEPVCQRVAEQAFGVGRDVGEAVFVEAHFPGDGVEAFDQATVVLFAGAQFVFEQGAA